MRRWGASEGKEADRTSDIWAFGSVLFEMLAGRVAPGASHRLPQMRLLSDIRNGFPSTGSFILFTFQGLVEMVATALSVIGIVRGVAMPMAWSIPLQSMPEFIQLHHDVSQERRGWLLA